MPDIEVLTLSRSVPAPVLDAVLTATEQALEDAGAERIWLAHGSADVVVMAELPVGG